ncbi:hypothetical protein [Microbulbifer pacificus]|uniref:hypothetical protein n=1 Tax=Microbulbifer pacificus TaxID=407164 RepID=UPI000CF3874F|nr:hypothetical protein [Microbulbifer pacificus]
MRVLLSLIPLLAIGVSLGLWIQHTDPAAALPSEDNALSKPAVQKLEQPHTPNAALQGLGATPEPPTDPAENLDVESEHLAVSALRNSMTKGDPRTPPLAPRAEARVLPSAQELADHKLYQAYETRQKQQVYASFAAAAAKKITDLEEMMAHADQGGVTPEQLAEGHKKLSRLREQQALLLKQHPEITPQDPAP